MTDTMPEVAQDQPMRMPVPVGPPAVGPPSTLDLWAWGEVLHRCLGEDDGEPHIMRGMD